MSLLSSRKIKRGGGLTLLLSRSGHCSCRTMQLQRCQETAYDYTEYGKYDNCSLNEKLGLCIGVDSCPVAGGVIRRGEIHLRQGVRLANVGTVHNAPLVPAP